MLGEIVAGGARDEPNVPSAEELHAYLRLLVRVRYGSENTFRAVHAPSTVYAWMKQAQPELEPDVCDGKSRSFPCAASYYEGDNRALETVTIRFFYDNVCPHFPEPEYATCKALFETSPLQAADYLVVAPDALADVAPVQNYFGRASADASSVGFTQLQTQYIIGRDLNANDWWRSLFPLRYSPVDQTYLRSGWGDRAVLAPRRRPRPIPNQLIGQLSDVIATLSARAQFLNKPFLEQIRVDVPPTQEFRSDLERACEERQQTYPFCRQPRRTRDVDESDDSQFMTAIASRIASLSADVSTSLDAELVAAVLGPTFPKLGTGAYQIEASWRNRTPVISISEAVVLNEYLTCLAAPGPPNKSSAATPSFAEIMVLLHAHVLDVATATGFSDLDADTPYLLSVSPYVSFSVTDLIRRSSRPNAQLTVEGDARVAKLVLDSIGATFLKERQAGRVYPTECVRDRLSFALAHEFAHLALGTTGNVERREEVADCAAYVLLRETGSSASVSLTSILGIGPTAFWNARGPDSAAELSRRELLLANAEDRFGDPRTRQAALSSESSLVAACTSQ
jgi:hypothetical protein